MKSYSTLNSEIHEIIYVEVLQLYVETGDTKQAHAKFGLHY